MNHEVSKYTNEQNEIALNSRNLFPKKELKVEHTKEAAYKEGYEAGYADGIEADESCVPETTYFKNDFKKAWDKSDTKAALAKVNGEK